MSKKFIWETNQSQTYTADYGSQMLIGDNFNKDKGCDFIMDAASGTLVLSYNGASMIHWPDNQGTSDSSMLLNIKSGHFILQKHGLNHNFNVNLGRGNLYPANAKLHIKTENNSHFSINGAKMVLNDDMGYGVDISCQGNSVFSITNVDGIYLSLAGLIVNSNASVKMEANGILLQSATDVIFGKPANKKEDFFTCTLLAKESIDLSNLSMIYHVSAKTIFDSKKSICLPRKILINDDAICIFKAKTIEKIGNDAQFSIVGSAQVLFTGQSSDDVLFDFAQHSYPVCLFNFIPDVLHPTGSFVIQSKGIGTAAQQDRLLNNKLVSIKGKPARKEEINISISDNNSMIISLKY